MDVVLDIAAVRHRYGTTIALDDVDLRVAAGECVALLGPNGAGKTTLIGLATGLLHRQSGSVTVAGGDPRRAATRRRIGVVQQSIGFPRTLTVGELVRGAAVRAGLPARASEAVLAEVGIEELVRRRAGKLSGGQQQRLQLAMGLVADPALLLLDEPTVGLDVAARRAFWRTLQARRDRGTGVLVTTHLVEEAAAVADRVVVLGGGRVVAMGAPAELAALLPDRTIIARTGLDEVALTALPGVSSVHRAGELTRLASADVENCVRALLAADPGLTDLRIEGAKLEEALVHLTAAEPAGVVTADTTQDASTQEVHA
ncbi:MAG TPA: ABC transporter ATP-binding protein [Egicoccus sp.]|nr:ABC transporter ATP-binding protein [Egicoccus sp.]HSK23166.1 ABC transporter ATP-binding protein [Egicoccus sp.]